MSEVAGSIRQHGAAIRPVPPQLPIQRLSIRELDVLHWLAAGKSAGDTATILGISVCTVRVYVRNIMRKLDAVNIPHAVSKGHQLNILPIP
ncbi:helix-turn-helix transcriptional regulator [Ramlibacter sp.]|uniref:helix-turn-helix domain-containing protein n=1 Tax=Ramlibacter sp. TaxID=1917967 RepID=UPI00180CF216|nr:helix-turn-helix transcriptional regulator [Ramlibacter sp.]MBA2672233.1 helix-turn-helix transcriptional regulator [Ramlibacter sp.]